MVLVQGSNHQFDLNLRFIYLPVFDHLAHFSNPTENTEDSNTFLCVYFLSLIHYYQFNQFFFFSLLTSPEYLFTHQVDFMLASERSAGFISFVWNRAQFRHLGPFETTESNATCQTKIRCRSRLQLLFCSTWVKHSSAPPRAFWGHTVCAWSLQALRGTSQSGLFSHGSRLRVECVSHFPDQRQTSQPTFCVLTSSLAPTHSFLLEIYLWSSISSL